MRRYSVPLGAALALAIATGAYLVASPGGAGTPPAITAVERQGDRLVVTGSGFGNPGAMVRDGFDGPAGGRVGKPWHTEAHVPGYEPRYQEVEGRSACLQEFFPDPDGPDQYNSTLGLHLDDIRQVYVRGVFLSRATGGPSRNVKPFALRGGPPGEWELPNARVDCYPSQRSAQVYISDCENRKKGGAWWKPAFPWADGRWHELEFWFDRDTGWLEVHRDGQREIATRGASGIGDCKFTNLYLMSYHATDKGAAALSWWWDELQVCAVAAPAAVAFGDAATWDGCRLRLPLVAESWQDDRIVAVAPPAREGWIYVVNAHGAKAGAPFGAPPRDP